MSSILYIVLSAAYIFGIVKFWTGFNRTNFDRTLVNRLVLGFLWPALIIANKSYRQNFQKALKG